MRANLLGSVEQFGSVRSEQRLVCGDDIAARVQRLKNVGLGRLDATHDFDHDVGTENQFLSVGCEQLGRKTLAARSIDVANGDANQLEFCANPGSKLCLVLGKQSGNLSTDRSGAKKGNAKRAIFDHGFTLSSWSLGSEGLW